MGEWLQTDSQMVSTEKLSKNLKYLQSFENFRNSKIILHPRPTSIRFRKLPFFMESILSNIKPEIPAEIVFFVALWKIEKILFFKKTITRRGRKKGDEIRKKNVEIFAAKLLWLKFLKS